MRMTRRVFASGLVAAGVSARAAYAQDDPATRAVVRQLRQQGFEVTDIRRTLLGRVRVVSERGDLERELVFDPRNGTILRDYTVSRSGMPSVGPSPVEDRGGSGGRDGDRDDDDDDRDDDDDDSDDSDDDSDDDDDDAGDSGEDDGDDDDDDSDDDGSDDDDD